MEREDALLDRAAEMLPMDVLRLLYNHVCESWRMIQLEEEARRLECEFKQRFRKTVLHELHDAIFEVLADAHERLKLYHDGGFYLLTHEEVESELDVQLEDPRNLLWAIGRYVEL